MVRSFWICLLAMNLPVLLVSVYQMSELEQYQFLPFVPFALGVSIFFRWDRQLNLPSSVRAWAFVIIGVVASIASVILNAPRLGALSFLVLYGVWCWLHFNGRGSTLISFWPPAWLLFRLPSAMEIGLVQNSQLQSSRLASNMLDQVKIPHVLEGNIFELSNGPLFVAEACSGIQSIFTLLFIALFIIPLFRRSVWMLPLYLASAVLWAILMNAVRIFAISAGQVWYDVDLSTGVAHTILGYICLLFAVVLLLSTDRFLTILFYPLIVRDGRDSESMDARYNPFVGIWNRLFLVLENHSESNLEGNPSQKGSVLLRQSTRILKYTCVVTMAMSGVLFLSQSFLAAAGLRSASSNSRSSIIIENLWKPDPSLVASALPSMEVVGHKIVEGTIDQPFGQLSDVWNIKRSSSEYEFAFSRPYPEWHDLQTCYRASGWELLNYEVAFSDSGWTGIEAVFLNKQNQFGYLWFCGCGLNGESIDAPRNDLISQLKQLTERQLTGNQSVSMIQLWSVAPRKFDELDLNLLREQFLVLRQSVIDSMPKHN